MTLAQKNLIDMLNETGVPTRKIASVLSQESISDCNGGCVTMDIQNYLGSKRRKLLKDGDAQRMYNYFIRVNQRTQTLFMQLKWMKIIAWEIVFGPMQGQGVNHHYQSIMFGCALLVNETTESYIWLLKTWLETMGGHNPAVIITDDDKAMAKAISYVLPNSIHRLCMWHILQKVPEHLAHVYNKYSSFHHCIHDTVTIEEFENEWDELVCKYELRENEWLKDLYMRREKWVPAYLRTAFCAGMSTTQRSESMNKIFKDFVHSSTLVSDFVHQCEKALDRRYMKKKEKDVKTRTTKVILKTCYKMEAEAGEVYTRKIFLLFQDELFSSQKHKASKYLEEGTTKTYKVMANGKEKQIYEVEFDGVEKKATCSCHMFEFVGILCRHILTVFVKKSLVDYLPKQYVLRRWTINVKDHAAHENLKDVVQEGKQISYAMMRNSLMIEFLKDVEEGQKSEKKHDYLALALQKTHCELLAMDDDSNEIENDDNSVNEILLEGGKQVLSNLEFTLQDPLPVASKGRPKSLRQKHPKENHVGKKRKCSICKQTGHIRTSCHQQNQPRDNANVSLSPTSQIFHQDSMPITLDLPCPQFTVSQDPKPSTFMDLMTEAGKNIYK
ncbi:protein FAR1-RELATED SEQUENCE 5-like [Camellia sinensis]|uniref:protein FAR1-RELATED SEQUENCE 5-like n=1 Tax=Camellia sinensis TaxID=4442 RepID=UPI001035D151|nr:protein FAR1-RELATED SEQUENCE 5-like [Camellia sinensis]